MVITAFIRMIIYTVKAYLMLTPMGFHKWLFIC
uniref:Uncharacterized protein n=1 Tax=Anguilla anguilla TaxID=7936 RepID=A0A0E9U340_ANGAN